MPRPALEWMAGYQKNCLKSPVDATGDDTTNDALYDVQNTLNDGHFGITYKAANSTFKNIRQTPGKVQQSPITSDNVRQISAKLVNLQGNHSRHQPTSPLQCPPSLSPPVFLSPQSTGICHPTSVPRAISTKLANSSVPTSHPSPPNPASPLPPVPPMNSPDFST
jgi:hypothetical protein